MADIQNDVAFGNRFKLETSASEDITEYISV